MKTFGELIRRSDQEWSTSNCENVITQNDQLIRWRSEGGSDQEWSTAIDDKLWSFEMNNICHLWTSEFIIIFNMKMVKFNNCQQSCENICGCCCCCVNCVNYIRGQGSTLSFELMRWESAFEFRSANAHEIVWWVEI